jgi:D-glycero-beta-D-manno-heptose-7-phosphate kinase
MSNILTEFKDKKILIAGDLMLDSYIFGKVDRISPEAPVPVVAIEQRENRLGGAANVARNIKALGAIPILCAVTGTDEESGLIEQTLLNRNISHEYVVKLDKRKTTTKIRIMAQKHQLLRLDYEEIRDLDEMENKLFLAAYDKALEQADAVILEDYNKGLLTKENIPVLIEKAHKKGIPVTVDPKKKNFWRYEQADLFKPNLKELKEALNLADELTTDALVLEAANQMRTRLRNQISMITLSERGVFIGGEKENHFIPAHLRNISDVSGAGDTVISVATLCLVCGMSMKQIAEISNLAGGLVCEEPGVVSINPEKLLNECLRLNILHEQHSR